MAADQDHYQAYYSDKLWNLLPAIYRALDTDVFNSNGPVRELVNRIGLQASILRRGIDRLWEDQSIESCDDWLIAYIGDLVATNLVSSLDPRGQRLDVAKTIYYRRRKGTVAVLEEIAANISGWDVRVVEFFRRLARTRHGLDPQIVEAGITAAGDRTLQLAQGLIGAWTNTQIGGWADLRNVYGASQAQSPFSVISTSQTPSAFDEYFHTADLRAASGRCGWYNIANLGVFVWRLVSFGLDQTTPVQGRTGGALVNCYTFDPTGRRIPLFAASSHPLGDQWVSPQEWQLPTPIHTPLLRAAFSNAQSQPLYAALNADGVTLQPNSLGIFTEPGSFYELIDVSQITTFPEEPGSSHKIMIFPEAGVFQVLTPPLDGPVTVTYHYAFSYPMGAGPYDRRIIGQTPNPTPQPLSNVSGGGAGLSALQSAPSMATVSVNDSLTYDSVPDITGIDALTLMARNQVRPVIRVTAAGGAEWSITGNANSVLVVEGLLISGTDVVLRGNFSTVTLTCCTFDPGNAPDPAVTRHSSRLARPVFDTSLDGRDLRPATIWVEAEIQQLNIDRCFLGPVRTRAGGQVEKLNITNSIVQAIPTSNSPLLAVRDVKDPAGLASRLRDAHDSLSSLLQAQLLPSTRALLARYVSPRAPSSKLVQALLKDLNRILAGPRIFDPTRRGATTQPRTNLESNRALLDQAYPIELADLTLGFENGIANLSRCTLLGGAYVHQLEASECILDGVVSVENAQNGCVRFSAWSTGSVIPRQYESVEIAPGSPLFVSRAFGQPGYAQLLDSVDNEMLSAAPGATISQGAQDGSEMGAFAAAKNPMKERSILLKYQEYMPLGLNPLIIHVT